MLVETRRCGRLYVDVRGSGPPIVLWHSLLCDGRMWSSIPEHLCRTYRVISIDGPGHGRSARVRAPFTMDDCVQAALDVLEACAVDRAIFCGLSWGGMVGMRLAFRRPDRVAALVLLDTNADAERRDKLVAYRAMATVHRFLGPVPALLDRLEPIFFSPHTLREQRPIVDEFRQMVAGMDRESVRHALEAVIFGRDDVRPRLAEIAAPTLVLVGEDDLATPLGRSRDIAARIAGARLVTVARAGHLSAWEQPDAVRGAIEAFLATTDLHSVIG